MPGLKLGGVVAAQFRNATDVAVIADLPGEGVSPRPTRRSCSRHHAAQPTPSTSTRRGRTTANGKRPARPVKVTIHCANPSACRKAFADAEAVVDGVIIARDLVNEPANILGPVEFAAKAKELEALGVKVEILTEKEMTQARHGRAARRRAGLGPAAAHGRHAVEGRQAQGRQPIAFVGKGVVFDSGGISIKPAGGMEDMKGDMGGAAAVTGLMHALAARKAKANVVGIIGCVENMLDGNAQRPGDIVTSMSGQTIEVINTDAEGRLVLADALWYCNERFKPDFMINLATLTGAIMVALGSAPCRPVLQQRRAGRPASRCRRSATQEKLWRMPLGSEYDKMIDTKNADMKNIGGRYAGSITAAQFLKRFVKETPWAHLDIAGTAMGSPSNEINQSWASGFGVRLLDRLVRDTTRG